MGGKAVIIEDNEDIGRALQKLLRLRDFEVSWSLSDAPALTREEWREIRFVVCDLALPGKDGVELAIDMRRRGYPGPICFITGTPIHSLGAFSASLEPHCLISKPFRAEELLEKLCL